MAGMLEEIKAENELRRGLGLDLMDALLDRKLIPPGTDEARHHGGSELYTHLFGRDFPPVLVPPATPGLIRNFLSKLRRASPIGHVNVAQTPMLPSPEGQTSPEPALIAGPTSLRLSGPKSALDPQSPQPDESRRMSDLSNTPISSAPPTTGAVKADADMRRFLLRVGGSAHQQMANQNLLPEELADKSGVSQTKIEQLLCAHGESLTLSEVFSLFSVLGTQQLRDGAVITVGYTQGPTNRASA